jgi:hypothetical protein
MTKILAILSAIGGFLAMFFKAKADRVEKDAAIDRAETAEKGLENAKSSLKIDTRVKSLDDATRERLRDKFTQRRRL